MAISDPQAATAIVQQSFQAWQSGRTIDDLRRDTPPIYVAEDLWNQQARLTEFSIDDECEVVGTNVRVPVTIKGSDAKGRAFNRRQNYLVTTTPAITIAREDR